jgi:serine/threonine-protein kinase
MSEFLKWLSAHPAAAATVVGSFGIVTLAVTSMYVVAFVQGRSVSFWPPKIGPKPDQGAQKATEQEVESRREQRVATASDAERGSQSNPIVQKGTALTTASGTRVVIESDFYSGATATLFRASMPSNERVMVKVFWRGLMPGSKAWELFNREQRVAEMIAHRNIVRTLDRGLRGGYPFTVLEYFGGGTLRDWLLTHDRIPGADILSIAGQIADALDFAHSRGVLHMDIKPGNILFESDPQSRVALGDFGIARILGAVERNITAAEGEFVGSPGYLAPEVFRGRDAQPASDIYSFGVVFYEMITGKIPFDEIQEVHALMLAKTERDAPDIRTYRKNVPEAVAERLEQTLRRTPAERPCSARAVLSGLEGLVGSL